MKAYYTYFLVDTLSETIVGSFSAISDHAARKMLYEAIKKNPVFKDMEDCLKLYRSNLITKVGETYAEVVDDEYSINVNVDGVFADAD